jgi:hypothetical protein
VVLFVLLIFLFPVHKLHVSKKALMIILHVSRKNDGFLDPGLGKRQKRGKENEDVLIMLTIQHIRPNRARNHTAQRPQRTAAHLMAQERAADRAHKRGS